MKRTGVPVTKHIFMAQINAYAACGQIEKAKQVVLDKMIHVCSINEIKSVLVSALALNGMMPNSFLYKEIKQNGGTLEPKVAIALIHFTSEGELSILLQVLEEIQDPDYWVDGCCRLVLHCVRNKHLRSAIDLLKQLNDKLHTNDLAMEAVFDENSLLIWSEYQAASLRFNVLTFLRMYQVLLASGDPKSAKSLLTKIPMDDPHVRCIIKACQETYVQSSSMTKTKKQKLKNKT
ncbi:Tetratricopeptide repeat-like superfamily protein, putative isoform 2 [Hibiscus syriacus]|uniref:Tetratricopeptide repeat-like superfamily protein, putative isoform 2 n=1 Tax=Hibiscus syriacus TaxID=106335 RepID=A0A6A2XBT1_HIBSY|nr:Tetratricopeptide repeat-like superfamily protein, putative isoform 2 [Hibiscus syriacus]